VTAIVQKAGKKFLVPKGWSLVTIGDLFKVTRGKVLPMGLVSPESTRSDPYPVYSSQTKKKGLAGFYSEYLYEDAITWTTDGANAGDVNFRAGKFYCTNVCGVLLNTHGHANACVASILNSVTRGYVSYVGNPKLMNDVMATINIPLPPLVEQRKIAEILRTWDEAIETAEAELKAKQEMHQCLLQKAFSQGACIAAGEGKLLGEVVRLVKGKKPELCNEQFKGAVPYLVARFIRGEEPPQFASLSDKNAVSVDASDIVIICDGSNSGEMFTGLDGVLSSTMAKLIPTSSDFEKAYVRYFVGYNGLRLSEAQEGGAIPHLDREKLLNFRIPMLEKKEQQLVIERLNASERAVQFVNERTELLRTQKRGLMQKLLTGEVRVAA
jgi:type I restriction enzyme S subunit